MKRKRCNPTSPNHEQMLGTLFFSVVRRASLSIHIHPLIRASSKLNYPIKLLFFFGFLSSFLARRDDSRNMPCGWGGGSSLNPKREVCLGDSKKVKASNPKERKIEKSPSLLKSPQPQSAIIAFVSRKQVLEF